jgi:hypothetical protein
MIPSESKKRCAFVPSSKCDMSVYSPNQATRHLWASRRRDPIASRGLLSGMIRRYVHVSAVSTKTSTRAS